MNKLIIPKSRFRSLFYPFYREMRLKQKFHRKRRTLYFSVQFPSIMIIIIVIPTLRFSVILIDILLQNYASR